MTQAAILAASGSPGTTTGFKNKLINGNMMIDQRNAGASVTLGGGTTITLDRWSCWSENSSKYSVQQNAGSVTPPAGFSNYLGVTSLAATTVGSADVYMIRQYVEGFNFADCNWGTANAKTVTLSFWVRSSLTGTFGGAFYNSAGDRSYPFTYTISSANTWEQKSITVAGDTTGTWVGATNGKGVSLALSLGAGSTYSGTAGSWASAGYFSATGATQVVATNGATWYITGVQLEVGTTATNFDFRSYGTELQLCQRYYWKNSPESAYGWIAVGRMQSTYISAFIVNPVNMRAAPTFSYSNLGAANGTPTGAITATYAGTQTSLLQPTFTGITESAGYINSLQQNGTPSSGYLAASAEL